MQLRCEYLPIVASWNLIMQHARKSAYQKTINDKTVYLSDQIPYHEKQIPHNHWQNDENTTWKLLCLPLMLYGQAELTWNLQKEIVTKQSNLLIFSQNGPAKQLKTAQKKHKVFFLDATHKAPCREMGCSLDLENWTARLLREYTRSPTAMVSTQTDTSEGEGTKPVNWCWGKKVVRPTWRNSKRE